MNMKFLNKKKKRLNQNKLININYEELIYI